LVEFVYRAGTPDGRIPPGICAQIPEEGDSESAEAREVAEPGQDTVIDDLIRFYHQASRRLAAFRRKLGAE